MRKMIDSGVEWLGAIPKDWDLVDHVLGRFTTEERKLVDETVKVAVEAVEILVSEGLEEAMNRCNRTGK